MAFKYYAVINIETQQPVGFVATSDYERTKADNEACGNTLIEDDELVKMLRNKVAGGPTPNE